MARYRLISTILLSLGSVIGIVEYLKPKDVQTMLRWKGVRLVSSDNGWKAVFYENEDKLRQMGISDFSNLKDWCLEKYKYGLDDQSLLSIVEENCKDNPKTIMGNVIRAGEKNRWIVDDKDFSIIYAVSGEKKILNQLINAENADNQSMGKKLSAWCEAEKKSLVKNPDHLLNVKKYCYGIGARNVKELLTKKGLTLLGKEGYKRRFFEELINSNDLYEDLKETYKEEEIDAEILEKWCDSKFEEELDKPSIFPDVYARVESRCTEKINFRN